MKTKSFYAARKRRRRQQSIILVCAIVVFVVATSIGITRFTDLLDSSRDTQVLKHVPDIENSNELTLLMVGDNLLHMPLVSDAKLENGNYNFDFLYDNMKPYFQNADLSVIVQETILGGESFGYSGYPLFNSPQEVGDAISNAGFNIVLHATNHTLDKGAKGIENTIEYWKTHPEITVLGINESVDDYNTIRYVEKNGIKLALLNYTDSTNGNPVPDNKSYLINTVQEDKIQSDLQVAEENADFTVVFMHWGTEYSLSADEGQKKLAQMMCMYGADLIMGSHPHVIEPVEWIETENGNKALVYYSLGNYVSRQKEATNLLGALAEVKICENAYGETYVDSASIMPIVTHYNQNSRGFCVYPLKDYTDDLAAAHGVAQYDGKVSKERFDKIFNQVFEGNTAVTIIQ